MANEMLVTCRICGKEYMGRLDGLFYDGEDGNGPPISVGASCPSCVQSLPLPAPAAKEQGEDGTAVAGVRTYWKKPVAIQAIRFWPDNLDQAVAFCGGRYEYERGPYIFGEVIYIKTLEGEMAAVPGDFIIKGVYGEFCPCKPDIFEETYSDEPPAAPEPATPTNQVGPVIIQAYMKWTCEQCGKETRHLASNDEAATEPMAGGPGERCAFTRNPCGTDTWSKDKPCRCEPCQKWLCDEIDRQSAELTRLQADLREIECIAELLVDYHLPFDAVDDDRWSFSGHIWVQHANDPELAGVVWCSRCGVHRIQDHQEACPVYSALAKFAAYRAQHSQEPTEQKGCS